MSMAAWFFTDAFHAKPTQYAEQLSAVSGLRGSNCEFPFFAILSNHLMVYWSIPLRSLTVRELLPLVRNSGQIGEKGADQPERERLKNVEPSERGFGPSKSFEPGETTSRNSAGRCPESDSRRSI